MMSKKKVNWRKEYKADNVFNTFIGFVILIGVWLNFYSLIVICTFIMLYINISSAAFFNPNRYEQ